MDGVLQRLRSQQAAPARALGRVPRVFEEALGVGVFAPSATITDVSPTIFRPGGNIDIKVAVHASNPETLWSTCIAVKRQDTGVIYQNFHGMLAADDDFVESIVCGVMPDESVQLEVEVWGHPDYWTTSRPY